VKRREYEKPEKLNELYQHIVAYKECAGGISPTVRELCAAMDINSTSSLTRMLDSLKRNGRIDFIPGQPRTIRIPGEKWVLQ
jgi:SOS-response transcriptional repressor LexA